MRLLFSSHLILALLVLAGYSKAQTIFQPSSRSQALAEIYAPLAGTWSAFGNQAGLSQLEKITAGVSYQNRFMVDELSTRAGFIAVPVLSSAVAITVYQFGKIPFRQEEVGLAYARKLGSFLNFGLKFNYFRVFLAEENRSAGSAGVELGLQYLRNEKLVVGVHVKNPYQTKLKLRSSDFRFEWAVALGAGYLLSDSFRVLTELEENAGKHLRVKAAAEYDISRHFFLRMGMSGKPYQLSGGVGFHLNQLVVDIAGAYHQYLGNTPSASVCYSF